MSEEVLVPLKQAAGALGVSRATLWRASKVVPGFPPPRVIARRVYWKASELEDLRNAISRFAGRVAFEQERRLVALRAERDNLARRRRTRRAKLARSETDLFGWSSGQ